LAIWRTVFLTKKFRKIYLSVKTNYLPAESVDETPDKGKCQNMVSPERENIEPQHIFSGATYCGNSSFKM